MKQTARFSSIRLASACLLLGCCSLLAAGAASADDKRPISAFDLFKFHWIGDPQLSADGGDVAYVEITVDEKRADYETAIWAVRTTGGAPRRLTAGTHDSSPRWSPDGKILAFLRVTEKDGKPQPPQIYLMPMQGGEPVQLSHQPQGAFQAEWSGDGNTIAFISGANEQDMAIAACEAGKDSDKAKCKPLRETDVRVVTRAQYRLNNVGYLDFSRPLHIWTISATPNAQPAPVARQLTKGEFSEGNFAWSRDGSQIYYASNRDLEPYYQLPKSTIYAIPREGGEASEVSRFEGMVSGLTLSPQGNRLAFLGMPNTPVQSHRKTDLWLLDLATKAPARSLTADYDWEIGGGIIGDMEPPRAGGGSRPAWSADGNSITVVVAKQGRANLDSIDVATRAITPVTNGNQAVGSYASNGTQVVAAISDPVHFSDLFMVAAGSPPKRLTTSNDALFASLKLTPPEEIWYSSFDGKKINALVQLPPDFDAKKKYPLILNIHGGPHAAYGYLFFHEMQWMAAKGYVVLYPNPRGSTSYGEAFANVIQYHYPGDDYRDLMAGVDELIRRGYIDTQHIGVTGGSGGGLLTNWVIGHTNRFAAAVSQRDIADWAAWWYTDDFLLFQPNWFRKPPFEDPAAYREHSPITYINNVKTPTMFILGDSDSRTPPETGGDQMFRALKYRKIPSVEVRFPGESHELSRSGKPWHRVERLQHIVNWFDVYLQGKKTNEYDLAPPATPDLRVQKHE